MVLFYLIFFIFRIQARLFPADLKNGIYSITFKKGNLGFSQIYKKKEYKTIIDLKPQDYKDFQRFRIKRINANNTSAYYIESLSRERLNFQNGKGRIILVKKDKRDKIFIIIKDEKNNYYIRDRRNNKFIGLDSNKNLEFKTLDKTSITKNKNYQIEIKYLYQEYRTIKSEKLESTKIDVVYTFVDNTDPNLHREGIEPLSQDEENNELKYSLRSVLKNIPWVNKIFIITPNEKVKFLKNDFNDSRIVYVKDEALIGFNSSSSLTFEFNLWKLKQFGASDNIIYLNDDFFIGRNMKKEHFFYEDQNGTITPLCYYGFDKIYQKNDERLKIRIGDLEKPAHSGHGFALSIKRGVNFLFDILQKNEIRKIKFHQNALPVNLNEVKEIYDLIDQYYEHKNELLYALKLNNYQMQFQNLYLDYTVNKYDRPLKRMVSYYIDMKKALTINKQSYNSPLFCINSKASEKYTKNDYKNEIVMMESLFPEKTVYELDNIKDEL